MQHPLWMITQSNQQSAADRTQEGLLSGVRVVDLSTVLAGPHCAQMMADMGADVIKVERPGGDENRKWPPISPSGDSCNFMSVNRGKRSIMLDLRDASGQATLHSLLATADVLIYNYLPRVAKRLKLDFDTLVRLYPDLIVCSISGYGSRGPLKDEPGFDATVGSFCGITGLTGEPGRTPVRSGVSAVDLTTGVYAYAGILTALRSTAQPRGQLVEVSLLETAISFLAFLGVGWLEAKVLPKRAGSGHEAYVPYQIFKASDAEFFVGALTNQQFESMCDIVERGDIKKRPGFDTLSGRNACREELINMFAEAFARKPAAHWEEKLRAAGVPVARINTIAEALEHEQVLANDMVIDVECGGGVARKLLGMPFKIGGIRKPLGRGVPGPGEHTQEILEEIRRRAP